MIYSITTTPRFRRCKYTEGHLNPGQALGKLAQIKINPDEPLSWLPQLKICQENYFDEPHYEEVGFFFLKFNTSNPPSAFNPYGTSWQNIQGLSFTKDFYEKAIRYLLKNNQKLLFRQPTFEPFKFSSYKFFVFTSMEEVITKYRQLRENSPIEGSFANLPGLTDQHGKCPIIISPVVSRQERTVGVLYSMNWATSFYGEGSLYFQEGHICQLWRFARELGKQFK